MYSSHRVSLALVLCILQLSAGISPIVFAMYEQQLSTTQSYGIPYSSSTATTFLSDPVPAVSQVLSIESVSQPVLSTLQRTERVAIIVASDIYEDIQDVVNQYRSDLEALGHSTILYHSFIHILLS